MTLHCCGLRGLSSSLSSFIYTEISHFGSKTQSVSLTLTAPPTQPDSAAPDRETLHFLDRPFSIWFADELNESAVFPSRNLDLHTNENRQLGGLESFSMRSAERSGYHRTVQRTS